MKRQFAILALLACGCTQSNFIKYGYLPGGEYPIYESNEKVDLGGKILRIKFVDGRSSSKVASCFSDDLERDSELEGEMGRSYFENYFHSLVEKNNGKVDSSSDSGLVIELRTLSPKLIGFGHVTVHGITEFKVKAADTSKIYCVDIKDGDRGSPLGKYSFATRKSAFRKMVSASTSMAIQRFIKDYETQVLGK